MTQLDSSVGPTHWDTSMLETGGNGGSDEKAGSGYTYSSSARAPEALGGGEGSGREREGVRGAAQRESRGCKQSAQRKR